jgi:hypothetical protein
MKTLIAIALGLLASTANAQMEPTPPRDTAMAAGPYETLVIRGATIITGNGGPPYGPADIIIKEGRIADYYEMFDNGYVLAQVVADDTHLAKTLRKRVKAMLASYEGTQHVP